MTLPATAFLKGFKTLFSGMKLIRQENQILKLAIIPFAIDFIILSATFFWGSGKISGWTDQGVNWIMPEASGFWHGLLYYPFYLIAWVVFLAFLFFIGYIAAGIVASPFNSLLAEKTLMHLGAIGNQQFVLKRWISISIRMFWTSLLKSLLFVFMGLIFFGVSFIPMIGIIASIGIVLIMSFDSADYSFEILEYSLSQRLNFFRKNFFFFLGSAASMGLTLLIPGLNFLLFPVAVVGHAKLVNDCLKQNA